MPFPGVFFSFPRLLSLSTQDTKSFQPVWLYTHAGTPVFTFLLGTVGFTTVRRLRELFTGVACGIHRKLGLMAFGFGAILALAEGLTRLREVLEVVPPFCRNAFQGFEAMGLNRSCAKLTYCHCLSTLIGACISLEANSRVIFFRKSKEEKTRREGLIWTSKKEKQKLPPNWAAEAVSCLNRDYNNPTHPKATPATYRV